MEDILILVDLIGIVIALILAHYIAKQFHAVATDKGYPEKKYYHICFWLGLIGYLLVIALPDRNRDQVRKLETEQDRPSMPVRQVTNAPAEDLPDFEPIDTATAFYIGENNLKCANCQRVQFRGNQNCCRCGAKFVNFMR